MASSVVSTGKAAEMLVRRRSVVPDSPHSRVWVADLMDDAGSIIRELFFLEVFAPRDWIASSVLLVSSHVSGLSIVEVPFASSDVSSALWV